MNVRADLVAIYVVRPAGDGYEVLQLRRAPGRYLAGEWTICSGHVEAGETAVEAAKRELLEETGLTPRRLSFLSYVETFYLPAADAVCHRAGFCAVVDADAIVTLSDENDDDRWISHDRINQDVLWPGERAALAEIFSEHLSDAAPRAAALRRVD